MINPFKNKGFRNLIYKGLIVIILIIIIQEIINSTLFNSALFNKYLDTPSAFQIGKGIIALSIENAIIFGFVVFLILTYKRIFEIKLFRFQWKQSWFFVLTLFFIALHYLLKYLINRNIDFFSQAVLLWAIVKVLVQIFAGMALFLGVFGLDFTKYFIKEYKKEIILVGIITVCFFILMLIVQNLWTVFSSVISKILFWIFSLFFKDVTYQPYVISFTMSEGGGPMLGIGSFKAIVGKPCSGIDSFLLFTSLYTLIYILDYKRLKKGLAVGMYFAGVIGMFLVNALRILLLFIVGAYIDAKFAIGMFHTNVGWILFIIYFFIYWWIVSKKIYKRELVKK